MKIEFLNLAVNRNILKCSTLFKNDDTVKRSSNVLVIRARGTLKIAIMEDVAIKTTRALMLEAKKKYEQASNTILVKRESRNLKGAGEIVTSLVYSNILYECKAGQERKPQSNGIRKSSTYKRNCSFKVRLAFQNNQLVVTSANLKHENHSTSKVVFDHYPENMRLTNAQVEMAKTMISVGGNKQLINAKLMAENEGKPVLLKQLHNMQNKERPSVLPGESELEKLLLHNLYLK